ncbi:hypothetical protein ADEAN_000251200 [Angomonas deanei]|uniref:Uncharacterized protein n=1 Tax=Angomonas deanei TaxID=59799 RepID=A0A7G2C632_9TRYP|nr:hypothetical protein ADEAN_000251200 [Angomonas deanei]
MDGIAHSLRTAYSEAKQMTAEEAITTYISSTNGKLPTPSDWWKVFASQITTVNCSSEDIVCLTPLSCDHLRWMESCWRCTLAEETVLQCTKGELVPLGVEWMGLLILWCAQAAVALTHTTNTTVRDYHVGLSTWLTDYVLPLLNFCVTRDGSSSRFTERHLWTVLFHSVTLTLDNMLSKDENAHLRSELTGLGHDLDVVPEHCLNYMLASWLLHEKRPVGVSYAPLQAVGAIHSGLDRQAVLCKTQHLQEKSTNIGSTSSLWFIPLYKLFLNMDYLSEYVSQEASTLCVAHSLDTPFRTWDSASAGYYARPHDIADKETIERINTEMNQIAQRNPKP